jgi:uncharacterized protein (TIGR03083 family)
VRALVESAADGALDAPVPATPSWRARDLVAHLAGVPDDVVNGRLDGVATDAWTQAQVDRRADMPVDAILDAWDADGAQVEAIFAAFPPDRLGQMLFDAMTHEHDLRHALGACGAQDTDLVAQSFGWVVRVGSEGRADALRLETEVGPIPVGAGDPVATITLSRFEFLRAVSGRRSARQINAYDWHGAAARPELLLTAPIFTLATSDIDETPRG